MLVYKSTYDALLIEHDLLKRQLYNEVSELQFQIANLNREKRILNERIRLLDRMDKSGTVDAFVANIEASGKIRSFNYNVTRITGAQTIIEFNGDAYVNS
jgi:ABC-type phosphate transport system substrate-binding protein